MLRRKAIENIGLVTLSAIFLPHCTFKEESKRSGFPLNHLILNTDQESLLADLAEALLPGDKTIPSGKALNLHHFFLNMVDDTFSSENRTAMNKSLELLEKTLGDFKGSKAEFIKSLETAKEDNADLFALKTGFYNQFKNMAIWGFKTSEVMASNVYGYKLVPGSYTGEFQINPTETILTIQA